MITAEKATSTPTNVLRYNEETQQLEPVEQDPAKELYKQKLQDAIKALSAKKLNPERLKEALEGFDEDPEEQAASATGLGRPDVTGRSSAGLRHPAGF